MVSRDPVEAFVPSRCYNCSLHPQNKLCFFDIQRVKIDYPVELLFAVRPISYSVAESCQLAAKLVQRMVPLGMSRQPL